jgi:hypothetical protein
MNVCIQYMLLAGALLGLQAFVPAAMAAPATNNMVWIPAGEYVMGTSTTLRMMSSKNSWMRRVT